MARLSRSSKVAITVVVVLIFLPLALWMWRNTAVASHWAEMERKVARLLAESRARSGVRPVLRGDPQPGKAWEKYNEAIRLLGNWAPRGGGPYVPESPEWYAEQLKWFAPAAAPFREGVARGDGQRQRNWEGPETPPSTDILHLVGAKAHVLQDAGKPLEAARWLLDALQFCGDLERNSSREDAEQANRWRTEAMSDLQMLLGRLNPAECSAIARELERLDEGYPSLRDSLLNTAMSQGCMYLDVSRSRSLLSPAAKVSWRNLYSEQVVVASAFFAELNALRRIGETEALPWTEARDIQDRALRDLFNADNLLLKQNASRYLPWQGILQLHRMQRAQLNLLRAAAHTRATGSVPSVPDPFGTTLRHAEIDGRTRIWSVGGDGIDDGGKGEGDIVVEPGGPK